MPKTLTLEEWDIAIERFLKFSGAKMPDRADIFLKIIEERQQLINGLNEHVGGDIVSVIRHRAAGLLP